MIVAIVQENTENTVARNSRIVIYSKILIFLAISVLLVQNNEIKDVFAPLRLNLK